MKEKSEDVLDDEYSDDVERLQEMKEKQMQRLQMAQNMANEASTAIIKINSQLEFIEYRRSKEGGNGCSD